MRRFFFLLMLWSVIATKDAAVVQSPDKMVKRTVHLKSEHKDPSDENSTALNEMGVTQQASKKLIDGKESRSDAEGDSEKKKQVEALESFHLEEKQAVKSDSDRGEQPAFEAVNESSPLQFTMWISFSVVVIISLAKGAEVLGLQKQSFLKVVEGKPGMKLVCWCIHVIAFAGRVVALLVDCCVCAATLFRKKTTRTLPVEVECGNDQSSTNWEWDEPTHPLPAKAGIKKGLAVVKAV